MTKDHNVHPDRSSDIIRNGIKPYPLREGYVTESGERSELVFITQLMLNAISLNYELPHVSVSGLYDDITEEAVIEFQRINLLPQTGIVDPETWDILADEYNSTVNDNQ